MAVGGHGQRLDLELTEGCDHRCGHCYNVWNALPGDAQHKDLRSGPMLPTPALLAALRRAARDAPLTHITVTGGEPLLRRDALDVLAACAEMVPTVQLITNGSHVPPETARRLAAIGVRSVQLTLLAGDRELHDRLKGARCFDETARAALNLAEAGVPVQCCFVALSENRGELARVLELCLALGIRQLSYNRMSPTGGAVHEIERLLPDAEQIEEDLDTAERLGRAWGIGVSTAMPIPPCLVRVERYKWVQLGFCSTGSDTPHLVMDGRGDVRSCNLASTVLGNLHVQPWAEIFGHPYLRSFRHRVPEVCRGCAYERSCQGGCKESAFASFGDHTHPEPLLWRELSRRA